MGMNVRLTGTVTIKLFVTSLEVVQNLADYVYLNTHLDCDWCKNDKDDSYSIVCIELVNGRYYPSYDWGEPDEYDYEFEFDEKYYKKLVRDFEQDNNLELNVEISDLEVEVV